MKSNEAVRITLLLMSSVSLEASHFIPIYIYNGEVREGEKWAPSSALHIQKKEKECALTARSDYQVDT